MEQQEQQEVKKEWFTCAKSGEKFQYPDGSKCSVCKKMYNTKNYLYVDMEVVCLDCRRVQLTKIIQGLKMSDERQ